MSDLIIIGVDHGYAAMKTAHFSFPTGLVEYEHEPYTQKDVLEYNPLWQKAHMAHGQIAHREKQSKPFCRER